MATVGTTTQSTNDPSCKAWTWTVSSGLAAGNASDALDLRGMEIVEWWPTSITGYSSGNFTVGLAASAAGAGLSTEDAGRSKRSVYTSASNLTGYVILPPNTGYLFVTVLGTTPTAVTINIVARAAARTGRSAT